MNAAVWQKSVNTGAFILSIFCIVPFVIFSFIPGETELIFRFHPLKINLCLVIFTFFLGVAGFSGAANGKRYVMSIATLLITSLLSVLLLFILGAGGLLS